MSVNNINKEILRASEIMEVDESMTSAYVKLANGEVLKREGNGEYQSLKTGDRYIPVVIWKEDKKKTDNGFINITAQEEREYELYDREPEKKSLLSIFRKR